MTAQPNSLLVCGDTLFEMDRFYIEGAQAMRQRTPWNCNPYRQGSTRHDQWGYGHENESAQEHIRFGQDLLQAKPAGTCFAEDPSIPRNDHGEISYAWYSEQLEKLTTEEIVEYAFE